MNKERIKTLLLFLSTVCVGVSLVWGVIIYFDNWQRVLSGYDSFVLQKKPLILLGLSLVFKLSAKSIKC
jgi:hypothetical protein